MLAKVTSGAVVGLDGALVDREQTNSDTRQSLFLPRIVSLIGTMGGECSLINRRINSSFAVCKLSRHKFHGIEYEGAAEIAFVRDVRQQNIFTALCVEIVCAEWHPLIGIQPFRAPTGTAIVNNDLANWRRSFHPNFQNDTRVTAARVILDANVVRSRGKRTCLCIGYREGRHAPGFGAALTSCNEFIQE